MLKHTMIALTSAVAVGVGIAGTAEAASFTGLGDLPGGSFNSSARGVSADGSTVVGVSSSDSGTEAFI